MVLIKVAIVSFLQKFNLSTKGRELLRKTTELPGILKLEG